jgi:hypothetical protein
MSQEEEIDASASQNQVPKKPNSFIALDESQLSNE